CFCELVHLGASINKLSLSDHSTFCKQCIAIFNKRYNEFADPLYLLCFFLHPQYDGKKFKIIKFKIIKFKIKLLNLKLLNLKLLNLKLLNLKLLNLKLLNLKLLNLKLLNLKL